MKQIRWKRLKTFSESPFGQTQDFTLEYNHGDGWKNYSQHPFKSNRATGFRGENSGYATMQVLLKAGYTFVPTEHLE